MLLHFLKSHHYFLSVLKITSSTTIRITKQSRHVSPIHYFVRMDSVCPYFINSLPSLQITQSPTRIPGHENIFWVQVLNHLTHFMKIFRRKKSPRVLITNPNDRFWILQEETLMITSRIQESPFILKGPILELLFQQAIGHGKFRCKDNGLYQVNGSYMLISYMFSIIVRCWNWCNFKTKHLNVF